MKKKKHFKVMHWLNTGIFPASVMLSVGFNYTEINQLLTRKKADQWKLGISKDKALIESGKNFAIKRTISKDGEMDRDFFYIIFTECMDLNDYDFCKIAHEVLHICQFLLPDILDRDREFESEAYLHTHLMQQVIKAIRGEVK